MHASSYGPLSVLRKLKVKEACIHELTNVYRLENSKLKTHALTFEPLSVLRKLKVKYANIHLLTTSTVCSLRTES